MSAGAVRIDGRQVLSSGVLFKTTGELTVFSPFESSPSESIGLIVLVDDDSHDGELRYNKEGDLLVVTSLRQWRSGSETVASNVLIGNDEASEFVELRFSSVLIGVKEKHITKISYCILEAAADGTNL